MMTETTQGILLTYLFDNFEVGNRKENNQLKNASRKKMMAVINRDMVDIEHTDMSTLWRWHKIGYFCRLSKSL